MTERYRTPAFLQVFSEGECTVKNGSVQWRGDHGKGTSNIIATQRNPYEWTTRLREERTASRYTPLVLILSPLRRSRVFVHQQP